MRSMYILPVILFAVVLWEHVGKKLAFVFRPSVALSELVVKAQAFWKLVGIWLATVSSFLTYIELGEIGKSAYDIVKPVLQLFIISPTLVFRGYFETASSYANPYLIPIGSCLLIAILIYICYYFNLHKKIYETRACRILCRLCCCDALEKCLLRCWHELTTENRNSDAFNGSYSGHEIYHHRVN